MKRLIECVPNFSEGRDLSVIDALVEAMSRTPGATVLHRHSDRDHNRSVITIAGDPEAVAEAALLGVGKAAELIDLNRHSGVHPRIGATDVLPFVPVAEITLDECAALARRAGREIWERYGIPVYFYEAAATRPERVRLENIRRGQFEGLREEAQRNTDRFPDIGGPSLHPTAGAIAVGARKFLIAYNINLTSATGTVDVSIAAAIARSIRSSNGGMAAVKAIGVLLKERGLAQVSINLTDFETTPLDRVFEAVRLEAQGRGCEIVSSEIVGLVPAKALETIAGFDLRLENFSPAQVLENRLAAALADQVSDAASDASPDKTPNEPPGEAPHEALDGIYIRGSVG
jgi:glutamate formiminotransferase